MQERGALASSGVPALSQLAAGAVLIGVPFPMGFDKSFFKNISSLIEDYYKVYPCTAVSLTLRILSDEYNIAKILKADDTLLTFSYYSESEKTQPLTGECREKSGESTAWPALTVPYQAILSVELNPGKAARDREIGFKVPANL